MADPLTSLHKVVLTPLHASIEHIKTGIDSHIYRIADYCKQLLQYLSHTPNT